MTKMLSTGPKTWKQVVNTGSSDAGNSVKGAMAETQSSQEGGLCVAQVVPASASAAKAGMAAVLSWVPAYLWDCVGGQGFESSSSISRS